MSAFNDDQGCFVCGQKNPSGLRLVFRDGGAGEPGPEVEAEVLFPAHLQGWQGTVHGGLVATVLDESIVKAAAALGITCVTAELTVKYRKPVATGVAYRVVGKVQANRGRIILAEGQLYDASGQVVAQAAGKLFKVR